MTNYSINSLYLNPSDYQTSIFSQNIFMVYHYIIGYLERVAFRVWKRERETARGHYLWNAFMREQMFFRLGNVRTKYISYFIIS